MSLEPNSNEHFAKSVQYWNGVEPTVNGVLGGFASVSETDIRASEKFLSQFYLPKSEIAKLSDEKANEIKSNQIRVLDVGSGIGRITKNLLLKFFDKVDLLDNCAKFLKEARNYIGADLFDQRVTAICSSLHEFEPVRGVLYDLIWIQWVIGHLYPDEEFKNFLNKCKTILKPNGLLIIKDNHTSTDENILDGQDGSVTRSYYQIISLIKQSGYRIVEERRQYKMPKGLLPIKMFCLKPEENCTKN